jgi:MFS family permease
MSLAFLAFAGLRETVELSRLGSAKKLLGGYASALRLLATRPQLQLSALVSLIFNSVVFVIGNSFLPVYIVHDLGESAILVGTVLATRNIAMTLSSLYFRYAVGRFGLIRTMIGANALAVAGVVGLSIVTDSRLLVTALVAQGLGIGFAAATANTLVASATGRRERALGFATNSFVSRGGSLLSPLLYGVILEISGTRAVFTAAAVLGVAYLTAMIGRARSVGIDEGDRWSAADIADESAIG